MERYVNHMQLGYLGLLPFLALQGWALLTGQGESVAPMFIYYSIAILSFLCGQLWLPGNQTQGRAIAAIVPTLPIPLLALSTPIFTLAWLGASYWLVLLFEVKSPAWQEHHKDYRKMRFILSSVVFVTHLLMIAFLLDNS
ncbi:DUF3429 domain-containing protein [Pseudoalteromonas sp. SSDWG2]|uniref:DUF3429 domain-containing protein n=1 Tax=Pseudoalteromonas sp. SSDWG2 TaxID=3139391 RepID=UPI003BAD7DD1